MEFLECLNPLIHLMSKKHNILDRLEEEKITTVDAGYRTYTLNIKKGLRSGADICYGVTEFDSGVLALERSMEHETARETLLHELTHIVLEMVGLGGHETTDEVISRTNEDMTTLISRGFLLLMNLNPKLFEVLNERHEG
jgi:hypothetical protein